MIGPVRKPPGPRSLTALHGAVEHLIRTIFPSWGRVGSGRRGAARSGGLCTVCRRSAITDGGVDRQRLRPPRPEHERDGGTALARHILLGNNAGSLFSPFELVWAGGATGRVAGFTIGMWGRAGAATAGALARYRERRGAGPGFARLAEAADRLAGTRPRTSARRRFGINPGKTVERAPVLMLRGTLTRNKVRFRPTRCNFVSRAPYLKANDTFLSHRRPS